MGKKEKKQKVKGSEKTAAKTDKKIQLKIKKELVKLGEEDLETVIAKIEEEEKKKSQISEEKVPPPSRRVNCTLSANPERDELFLYGGEYFNGQKTFVYGNLYSYDIKKKNWREIKSPGAPPPRCAHQTVSVPLGGGQLWIFGGEYMSPSQSQFYHYKDLWVYHMKTKRWEKIIAAGGPSARSGHRMTVSKKQLIVFGGFHDNGRDYKYYNDVYSFNMEDRSWKKIEPSGTPPTERSGSLMVPLSEGKIMVYGGYSKIKVKRDVDQGTVHQDAYLLSQEKTDTTGLKWKWQSLKPLGIRPSKRTGMSVAVGSTRAFVFGGVFDEQEDEESISSVLFNEIYTIDFDSQRWSQVQLTGKREAAIKPRRRKDLKIGEEKDEESEGELGETSEKLEQMVVEPDEQAQQRKEEIVEDDGIFKLVIHGPLKLNDGIVTSEGETKTVLQPSPRMNSAMALKHNILYLYGGLYEEGEDKLITFRDFYSIDTTKFDEWAYLVEDPTAMSEYLGSEDESDEDEEDSDEDGGDSEMEED